MQDSGALGNNRHVCGECLHYISASDRCDRTNGICYHGATACKRFESSKSLCGNCKHFLGGGDWNLCCEIKYDLVYEDSEVCDRYERI